MYIPEKREVFVWIFDVLLYGEDAEIYSLREKFSFFDKFTGLWYRNGIHVAWALRKLLRIDSVISVNLY